VGNLATTLMTCLLAFALLHPQGKLPDGFDIAVVQSEFFAVTWGDLGRLVFLFIAGAFLADTWLATVDCVARIHLDALGAVWPAFVKRDSQRWYRGLVLALAVITSVTMFFDQPGTLIIASAILGFAGTVLYSTALIALNLVWQKSRLPRAVGHGKVSLVALGFSTVCYLALAILYLRWQLPLWLR
jgi:hypothetical protein